MKDLCWKCQQGRKEEFPVSGKLELNSCMKRFQLSRKVKQKLSAKQEGGIPGQLWKSKQSCWKLPPAPSKSLRAGNALWDAGGADRFISSGIFRSGNGEQR